MSRTQTITNTWGGGSTLLGAPQTLSGDNDLNTSEAFGIVTNQAIPAAFAENKLVSIFILVDQDATLKANSSGSPTDTISLKAGVPFAWNKFSGIPYPFTGTGGAITEFFLTTTVATEYDQRILFNN